MSITTYKILSADITGKKIIDKADTFTGDPDIAKAWFDEYSDVIVEKFNDLIDAINTLTFSIISTAAASTAAKGTFAGIYPVGSIIEIKFENGNTAAAPSIVLDGDTHTITGMPTTAKLDGAQTYRFLKDAAASLTFIDYPDYCCEHGTSGVWSYRRYASGYVECHGSPSVEVSSSGTFGSGDLYRMNGTFTFPSGMFTATPECSGSVHSGVSSVYAAPSSYGLSATSGGIQILKTTTTTATITDPVTAKGTWK